MDPIDRTARFTEKIKALIDSSFASRYDDLEAVLEHALAAVALVEEARDELPPELVVAAWTQHGNALRLTGCYDEAELTLARAGTVPVSDLPTRIRLLEVQASLHRNTGRLDSAARFLAEAMEEHTSLGDPVGEAHLHNLLGIVYAEQGRRSEAFDSFQNAMDLLEAGDPPDVVAAIGHNLFETLIEAGELEKASAALVILEPCYRRLTSPRITGKAEWMRARLCRALDQLPAARLAYERAYEILSAEPRSPDLAALAREMADVVDPMPLSIDPMPLSPALSPRGEGERDSLAVPPSPEPEG